MVVLPLPKYETEIKLEPGTEQTDSLNWAGYAAGGALVAGGLLLLTGRRRAGTIAATAGVALALLDQQDTLNSWWQALPVYINQVQWTISQVQDSVNSMAAKREAVRRILGR